MMNKTKKITAVLALAVLFIAMMSSCHRNTCPTWNKADTIEKEVRS